MRLPVVVLFVCALVVAPPVAHAASVWGPLATPNPYLGPMGTATMHGDAPSSDATPLAGPGTKFVGAASYGLLSACPTNLQGSDHLVVALCTTILGQNPTVYLIDPTSWVTWPLASLQLTKGGLLGGVYAYLDNSDRLVVIDGSRRLLRVGHTKNAWGWWQLSIDESVDLSAVIAANDSSVGLVPDWQGNVWFATANGVVGVVTPAGQVTGTQLPAGEEVANSISSAPSNRIAVASTFALYELALGLDGHPQILWRAPYDRGSARKPGQLSWGTGSSPTYFGPGDGADYLTIVDNADAQVHLLVYRSGSGQLVCQQPVLTRGGPGSENSPVAVGSSVFVASTYGYPYPAVPAGAGPAVPATAPFVGGMTRVDVDGPGCRTVWDSPVRSAAVPRLSTADGNIYTFTRVGPANTTPLDGFEFTVLDPDTGSVKSHQLLAATIVADTLQTSTMVTMEGKVVQGTVTGITVVCPWW